MESNTKQVSGNLKQSHLHQEIAIPAGLKVVLNAPKNMHEANKYLATVEMQKGSNQPMYLHIPKPVQVKILEGKLILDITEDDYHSALNSHKKFLRSIIGTLKKILAHMMLGAINPYELNMEMRGIGYKANYSKSNNNLELSIGYSHIKVIPVPSDIAISILVNGTAIKMVSQNKQKLHDFGHKLHKIKGKLDYYGNTGIFRKGQVIKIKSINKK